MQDLFLCATFTEDKGLYLYHLVHFLTFQCIKIHLECLKLEISDLHFEHYLYCYRE